MVALAASPQRNVRIDHDAALWTTADWRFGAAMVQIGAGIGCHFISLDGFILTNDHSEVIYSLEGSGAAGCLATSVKMLAEKRMPYDSNFFST